MKLLQIYEKVERMVQRLPETLQRPILREITPIKTLFLLQRPPRVALLGERSASRADLLNGIFRSEVDQESSEIIHDGMWQAITLHARGTLRLFDARRPVAFSIAQAALTSEEPDLFILVRKATAQKTFEADLKHAAQLLEFFDLRQTARARIIALQLNGDIDDCATLRRMIGEQPALAARLAAVLPYAGTASQAANLIEVIAAEVPEETRLETARLSGNRKLQLDLAGTVVKSVTAICGAVGTQPIPLADFPILTSLQVSMVAGIMHISGREMSARLAAEFVGAIGANIGAGLVLREGARAVLKFVPVWGDVLAGAIAAGGTYAIGRAATAYFIEGASLKDARTLFRKRPRQPPLLKS